MKPWFTVPEVAETLRVSEDTVRELCATGRLRAAKVGRQWRIHPAALESLPETVTPPRRPIHPLGRWAS